MNNVREQDGFTLVELMVVVLIIGILVAIASPAFNRAQGTAKSRSCWANQREIETAAAAYAATNGSLWTQGHRFNGNGSVNTADVLVPTYLRTAPTCPESGLYYYVNAAGDVTGDMNAAGWTAGHSHY